MNKYVSKFKLFDDEIMLKDNEARSEIELIKSSMKDIKNEVTEIVTDSVTSAKRFGNFYQGRVQGTSVLVPNEEGELSDIISGGGSGTFTHPYTALNEYIKKVNDGQTHLQCTINVSGVYVIKEPLLSDCILNITVEVDDVEIILNMSDADLDFILANCYFNLQANVGVNNVVLHTPTNQNKIYIHNGSLILNRVEYDGCIVGYGSYVHIYNSVIGRLELNGCNGHLSENRITNKDNRYNGITITRGSNMELGGANADFADLNESGGTGASMIRIEGSSCALQYAQNVATNYLYGITCNSSTLYCTKARLDSFANNCANGNNISNTIVVQQNIGL